MGHAAQFNDTHKKFQLALNVYLFTTYYKEEKNWDMLLNHNYDVLYDWQREIQSLSDRGLLVERTSSNDKSKSDNRFSTMTSRIGRGSPGSLMVILSTTIPVCAN